MYCLHFRRRVSDSRSSQSLFNQALVSWDGRRLDACDRTCLEWQHSLCPGLFLCNGEGGRRSEVEDQLLGTSVVPTFERSGLARLDAKLRQEHFFEAFVNIFSPIFVIIKFERNIEQNGLTPMTVVKRPR